MRTAITLLAVSIMLAAVVGFWFAAQQEAPEPDPAGAEVPPAQEEEAPSPTRQPVEPEADAQQAGPVGDVEAAEQVEADADADAEAFESLHVREGEAARLHYLGQADPASPWRMRVALNPYGAGVQEILLSDYRQLVDEPDRYRVHGTVSAPNPRAGQPGEPAEYQVVPFSMRGLSIEGQRVALESVLWESRRIEREDQTQAVRFTAVIEDEAGQPVVEVRRQYELDHEAYSMRVQQRAINRSGRPLNIRWEQHGPGDMPRDPAAYLGDQRKYVSAYFDLDYDPSGDTISTRQGFLMRRDLIDGVSPWPLAGVPDASELFWLASENRYFAAIAHPIIQPGFDRPGQLPSLEQLFEEVGTRAFPQGPAVTPENQGLLLTLASEHEVGANQELNLSVALFAGPRKAELFREYPYNLMGFGQTIRYELGCTWCTFQWLAHLLLGFLKLIEGQVITIAGMGIGFHDWGVAIIILVLVVRLLLHPLTKKGQANMMKMGKQMQAVQPEMEKLKKKYKDDQKTLNQEMMKLYREKGVNPANMLGCLPMLIQMPIWIALYAMLYFAIELRHEPAFYGVFQGIGNLFGVYWPFLADLSSADAFLPLPGDGITLTWIPFIDPHFGAINLLPILMAVVFYFNQKLMAPPPANEQQAQQQKIMRIVIFIIPVLLYSAPSGLTLYILASTFGGIVDSWIVRRHVHQLEEEGRLFEKKEPKPGSLRDRFRKALEAKQKELEQLQQQDGGATKGKPKGGKKKKGSR